MNRTQVALSTVIALALVGLAVAFPAAAAVDGATNARTQANATPDASFDRDIYEVQQGEVVAIDVSLNHTDNVTLTIGGQEKPYLLRANVTDGNGDGKVWLQFDTASPDAEGALSTFHDADSVSVLARNASSGEFAGSYGMTLSYNGTRLDAAAMAVMTETTTTTTTTTISTTTTASTTTASTDPTDTTTDGQPGFGVAAALAAVVAAAVLAARR